MQNHRKIIYWAGFLYSISLALTYYINSSFLASWVGEKSVGLVYALASLVSLLALLLVPKIFRKMGGYKFLLVVAFFSALAYLGLVFASSPLGAIGIFVLSFTFNTLVLFSLDEFLKIFSRNREVGGVRGIYLTVVHVALISTQLAFWMVLGLFSFKIIYLLSFAVTVLFLGTIIRNLKKVPDPDYDNVSSLAFVGAFFKKRELLRAFIMSLLLQLFYAWMIIYTPIYLFSHLGFSWREIGIIQAIMLLPFLLIPYSMGRYGDKFGERKMLIWGFVVVAGATLMLFFIDSQVIWVWAFILFLTRIGAASIEVMSDAYFFKHITPENEEFIGVYRSSAPIAYIGGPLLASIIFLFVPSFNFIYAILASIMLFGIYLASTIRKGDI